MRRLLPALVILLPTTLPAQEIPPYVPANPMLTSRSPLYSQPTISTDDGWQVRVLMDYSNAIETDLVINPCGGGLCVNRYLLDAELLDLGFWVTRNLSPQAFVLANLSVRGGYDGVFDGFLDWFHDATGTAVTARGTRPSNTFDFVVKLPGDFVVSDRPGTFLGDVRLGGGYRLGKVQLLATVTLPTTTTNEDGWGREVMSGSLHATANLVRSDRIMLDAGLAVGATPTTGPLSQYQHSTFVGGMAAARWRFSGRQAVFATVWSQSPNWRNTGFDGLDRAELTIDFGGQFRFGRNWPEIQLGLTEDLSPSGPAIDVGAKIGVKW
jgi:hypothetical protein